ncbi:TIGR03546 family protein [Facilibium subflavum]|uniref:TIGR03546 family protein n=1 Tax=Facilibium subflavum TaxID=2219058 RepID=UPI0013C3036F|nr:TIGR03546 family protein [Facilibium subflavum]
MRFFKKIIATILGKATSGQLFLGCLFGVILGFIPGFSYSPLLSLLFIFLVLILNVNIGFVVIVFVISKILSFIIEPVSFYIGQLMIDGVMQPLIKWFVNTPVLAFAGFDYYLVTGAFVLSVILGIIFGIILVKLFAQFRQKMAKLQSDTVQYQKVVSKFWVKLFCWILFGKSVHKIDWNQLKDQRLKHPFRISGIIIVLIIIGLLFLFQAFLQTQMVRNILQTQLTKLNGATVDFKHVKIDFTDAQLSIEGLGVADPDNLTQDRFYAKELTAKLNIKALLTKRLVLSKVVVNGVSTSHQRKEKAVLYTKLEESPALIDQKSTEQKIEQRTQQKEVNTYSVEKYIKNTQKYRQYANDLYRIIQFISDKKQTSKGQEDRLETKQQVQSYGYANVQAQFLIDKTPILTIQKLDVTGIQIKDSQRIFDLKAQNIATEPGLLNATTKINLTDRQNNIRAYLVDYHQAEKVNQFSMHLTNIPAKSLFDDIQFHKGFALDANDMSLTTNGTWQMKNDEVNINLPIDLKLNQVIIKVNNVTKEFETLPLKINIVGNLQNPLIQLSQSQLQDILLQAGVSEVKSQIKDKLKDKIPKELPFGF